MHNAPCPFLVHKRCQIYAKRPSVCRQFPISFPKKELSLSEEVFFHCPNFDSESEFYKRFSKGKAKNERAYRKYLKKTYGSCYTVAWEVLQFQKKMEKKIDKLINQKKIKPKKIEEKDIKNKEERPILEFLVDLKEITKKERELIINRFNPKRILAKP